MRVKRYFIEIKILINVIFVNSGTINNFQNYNKITNFFIMNYANFKRSELL